MTREVNESDAAWFAPDSNFFLQCKPASDVDWYLITQATDIRLVVVRTVQREIDELKGGGNARRASRARATSGLFKRVLQSSDGVIVLREKGPRVSIELGPRLPADRPERPGLDLSLHDDQIVDQALETATLMDCALHLLTGDTGPMQTAYDLGLRFKAIPDEWTLPPEPDPQTKRIAELERKVESLSRQVPEITVDIKQQDLKTTVIRGVVDRPEVLPDEFIEQMRHEVAARHKMRAMPADLIEKNRTQAWNIYKKDWFKWLAELGTSMQGLAAAHNGMPDPVSFELHLNNVGAATAEHPQVEIATNGAIRLMCLSTREYWERDEQRIFSDPPVFVANDREASLLLFRTEAGPIYIREPSVGRERPGRNFSWHYEEPTLSSEYCEGDCLHLRHALEGAAFLFHLVPAPSEPDEVEGALTVRVSAKNLPEPFLTTVKVVIERRNGDMQARIKAVLKKELGLRIR